MRVPFPRRKRRRVTLPSSSSSQRPDATVSTAGRNRTVSYTVRILCRRSFFKDVFGPWSFALPSEHISKNNDAREACDDSVSLVRRSAHGFGGVTITSASEWALPPPQAVCDSNRPTMMPHKVETVVNHIIDGRLMPKILECGQIPFRSCAAICLKISGEKQVGMGTAMDKTLAKRIQLYVRKLAKERPDGANLRLSDTM